MKGTTMLVVAVFAFPLILAAFAMGWILSGSEPERVPPQSPPSAPLTTITETAPEEESVPESDVPGEDLAGLPRYPDSVRIEYQRELTEGLTQARTKYVVDAEPDEVRAFYREVFRSEGWSVGDLGFSSDRWYFFILEGEREALVEIRPSQDLVEIEIELAEPRPGGNDAEAPAPPPAPVQPTPRPLPYGDDFDDDDYYDDDFDDDGDD